MSERLDHTFVRTQIEHLRLTHPGIWDEGDEQLLADSLEGQTDFHKFLSAVVRRICEAEAFVDGIGDLIIDIKARQQRFERRGEAMRALAFKVMSAAEVRKVELRQATLSIRAGVPRVLITDETRLPPDCIRTRTEPNKIAIKERLERGDEVPGAEMSNREEVLSVRIK